MADEPHVIRGINWRETFPWTNIFRGFRVAIHPSKLILALSAIVIIFVGGYILDSLWTAHSRAVPGELGLYEMSGGGGEAFDTARTASRKSVESEYARLLVEYKIFDKPEDALKSAEAVEHRGDLKDKIVAARNDAIKAADEGKKKALEGAKSDDERKIINDMHRAAVAAAYAKASDSPGPEMERPSRSGNPFAMPGDMRVVEQIRGDSLGGTLVDYQIARLNNVVDGIREWNWTGGTGVLISVVRFVSVGPSWAFRYHPGYFIPWYILFLIVWSIFGGAITRIAAVHIAREEKLSIRQALKFSAGKFLSFFFAPLIPLAIVFVVGIVVAIGGLLVNIPLVGPPIVGLLFFLALAAGFVMTLVLIGTIGGFNLMYPTIAVEGSDSFDAISRSFSYVYARPWRMLFYTMVAIVYGAITYMFVRLFLFITLSLTHYFVGWWIFRTADNYQPLWGEMWHLPQFSNLPYSPDFPALGGGQWLGAMLIWIWVFLTVCLMGAYVISYYFSVNTLIYYLLRSDVDATEMDDVYLEQPEEDFSEAPAPPVATTTVATTVVATSTPTPVAEPPQTPPVDPPPSNP